MANTDAFSASIIPFEVPEQMRAFAEKGVSQARDSYAKFKDAAETHNGTIEAVFTTASKGASEYSAKLMEIMKANSTATLDFAQELIGVKSPTEAIELWSAFAKKQFEAFTRQCQGPRRAQPEGCDGNRRADQGQRVEAVQAGRLIRPLSLPKKPGRPARAFVLLLISPSSPRTRGPIRRDASDWRRTPLQDSVLAVLASGYGSRLAEDEQKASGGLAKARRCT